MAGSRRKQSARVSLSSMTLNFEKRRGWRRMNLLASPCHGEWRVRERIKAFYE